MAFALNNTKTTTPSWDGCPHFELCVSTLRGNLLKSTVGTDPHSNDNDRRQCVDDIHPTAVADLQIPSNDAGRMQNPPSGLHPVPGTWAPKSGAQQSRISPGYLRAPGTALLNPFLRLQRYCLGPGESNEKTYVAAQLEIYITAPSVDTSRLASSLGSRQRRWYGETSAVQTPVDRHRMDC